jgi:Multidrug resistance efflux pump
MRRLALICSVASLAACNRAHQPDAYGTFEANEVVVSAQTSGQLLNFTPVEGSQLSRGAIVGLVDTAQLALQRQQIAATGEATRAREEEAARQIGVLDVQRAVALRAYDRTRRLFSQKAATAQQLDQAERDYKVLLAQISAAQAQRNSITKDLVSGRARLAEIGETLGRSRIINPQNGTVLATFARAGEVVQPGTPLYRIANLDSLTLRAYISEQQLSAIKLGTHVQVNVDAGNGKTIPLSGRVDWISSKAEFTPTPVQTRDERADLVYAVKVLVANHQGLLKIGMPADIELTPVASRT